MARSDLGRAGLSTFARYHTQGEKRALTMHSTSSPYIQDLKADNILVDYSGTCKISDFGISKKASEMTRLGKAYTQMRGTIYWMAPEVLASTADGYDVKVDIWSVGCVAVEMWTGKRPWHPLPFPTVMIEVGIS